MSFAHTFVGQYIKPVPIFSTFSNSKQIKPRNLRYSVANSLQSSQWKIDLIGRPVQWVLARQSAWLLFGICSLAGGVSKLLVPPAMAEPAMQSGELAQCKSPTVSPVSALHQHGKKAITDYSVIGIPGDGRCLFRAIVHGAQIRRGKNAPNESLQRVYADELREQVVDELVKRRAETEWFIEGDFDSYTKRMRQPHVWGGEPELLMASHVLRMPITVYMYEQRSFSKGLISIAEYGQEYSKENPVPITVLYDGSGHYDALHITVHRN